MTARPAPPATPAPAPPASLTPAADPAAGPAWDITTPSRHQAAAIAAAIPGTTTRRAGPGQWHARIPRPALAVTATATDAATLTVRLDDAPAAGVLTLTFHPWTAADVLPIPPPELPASGRLVTRDIRISTLMGRTVRYLIPAFTTTGPRPCPDPAGAHETRGAPASHPPEQMHPRASAPRTPRG